MVGNLLGDYFWCINTFFIHAMGFNLLPTSYLNNLNLLTIYNIFKYREGH